MSLSKPEVLNVLQCRQCRAKSRYMQHAQKIWWSLEVGYRYGCWDMLADKHRTLQIDR